MTVIITIIKNSTIFTIIIFFVIENPALSLLLPLLLVFLFLSLLLILLYLFTIVSFSQCCYSYQVNIAIIVFMLISYSTLLLFICEFHYLKFSFN